MTDNRPHITNNFNAPIGQYIANVQSMSVTIDKEGNVHIDHIESAAAAKPRPAKAPKKPKTTKAPIAYTIHYINNAQSRLNRLIALENGLRALGWIEEPKSADDFQDLFTGTPRECNIRWTDKINQATIYYFLQQLLTQSYIKRTTGCSVASFMRNQFKMPNPRSNEKRVSEENKQYIRQLLALLDPQTPLPKPSKSLATDADDTSTDTAFNYLDEGLRATKGISSRH